MGAVTLGEHRFELPDDKAHELGEAAAFVQRKGGFIAPTDDLLIAITPATPVTVEIEGAWAEFPKPAEIIAKANARRGARFL